MPQLKPCLLLSVPTITRQAPGVAKYQPRLMYPRPSPGTLEVDPSMQVGAVGLSWLGCLATGCGAHAMPCHAMPYCVALTLHHAMPCPWQLLAAALTMSTLQWVHPAVNGVAIAADPQPLHNDLHTYLAGEGTGGLRDMAGTRRHSHMLSSMQCANHTLHPQSVVWTA